MPRYWIRLTLGSAALALLPAAAWAVPCPATCSSLAPGDCSTSACRVACDETELRNAVAAANACTGTPSFTRRIQVGPNNTTCTVDMAQTSGTPTGCGSDPISGGRGGVCITGHDITIDGDNSCPTDGVADVTFNYTGSGVCQNCSGSCAGTQPSLFTVKGTQNTLKNFGLQYFPEGLHVREGSNHTVTNVTDQFICEDAITVDNTAGTGIVISSVTLTGNTTAGGLHTCLNENGSSGPCGQDKAIQLNGGGATVSGSAIANIGQSVHVVGGTHTVTGNTMSSNTGTLNDAQHAVRAEGGVVTVSSNMVTNSKFGITVEGSSQVTATGNTITSPTGMTRTSAFSLRGQGLLKASGNNIKGPFNTSDCQRAAIETRDANGPSAARADFGGGDCNSAAVIGGTSSGGNTFCSTTRDYYNDVADFTCSSGTAGACIGVGQASNCFDDGPNGVADPAGTVRTIGATTGGCSCGF